MSHAIFGCGFQQLLEILLLSSIHSLTCNTLSRCRAACLQLHEDATERLRDAMTAEKETLLLEHRHQLTSLQSVKQQRELGVCVIYHLHINIPRDQLSSVQEEYVKLSGEKEMMVATHRNAIKQVKYNLTPSTQHLN